MACEGTAEGPCNFKDSKTVKLSQGDMMLCNGCRNIRFPLGHTGRGAVAASHPIVHTTDGSLDPDVRSKEHDDRSIVVNELLTFVVSKINHKMPLVTVVQRCSQFYSDEEIVAASKLLHDTCAVNNDPRHRKRQGANRKKATMEDIVSLIQRKGGDLRSPLSLWILAICLLLVLTALM